MIIYYKFADQSNDLYLKMVFILKQLSNTLKMFKYYLNFP